MSKRVKALSEGNIYIAARVMTSNLKLPYGGSGHERVKGQLHTIYIIKETGSTFNLIWLTLITNFLSPPCKRANITVRPVQCTDVWPLILFFISYFMFT